jgi:dynein heavy chain
VVATVHLYLAVGELLKPTPAKAHYVFNMRDVSRVLQGMTLLREVHLSSALASEGGGDLRIIRLWMHEAARVFYDRLIADSD